MFDFKVILEDKQKNRFTHNIYMFISNICGDIDRSRVNSILWSLFRSLKEFFCAGSDGM